MNPEQIVEALHEFIETQMQAKLLEAVREDKESIAIDFSQLIHYNLDLAEAVLEKPTDIIKAGQLVLDRMDIGKKLLLRFFNLPESAGVNISNIRSKHIGKLIRVKGLIRNKTDVRPQVVTATFECPACGNLIKIPQEDSAFKSPDKCGCGRKGKFNLVDKKLIDVQKMVFEEVSEDLEGGMQAKRITALLRDDLASPLTDRRTSPGTKVIATGIVQEIPIITRMGTQSINFDLVLFANHLEPVEEEFEDLKVSDEELAEITAVASHPEVFMKLRESIAPSIYGHEQVKDALVMQMFGGVHKKRGDGVTTRGDTHILLIGDPGGGKSQMLKRISIVAPKARFVSGKGVSGAGLTASVIRDELTNAWSLEAGALVLANKGYLMIDEMDKMNKEDRDAMHEGLEQQTISISKANIQATLRCQTSVLAAANPKFGRFDPYLSIGEQINMPPSLINRFDLIFPIKDMPDPSNDARMSRFILTMHKEGTAKSDVAITTELLRKYVAYAKQHIFPKLSDEAIEEIQRYYVDMRNSGSDIGGVKSVPISARQLEGLVRLSEASARIRFSSVVTKEDARRAIDLVQYCLSQIAVDKETGKIDIDKLTSGITATQRGKMMGIKEIISQLEGEFKNGIPVEEILKVAEDKGINKEKAEETLEKLKRSGDIYEPKPGVISKL